MEEGSQSPSAVRSGFLHELSIAESVVRIASRQADGRRVMKVQMKVGYLRQIVPSALSFGFGLLAEGTPVEGAKLEMEQVPAEGRCRGCGVESLLVESLELEEA